MMLLFLSGGLGFHSQGQILNKGLTQISGEYANSTTTVGAVANRKTADALYKQSLADERAAWSSFPPNVALLSKALKEAQDGVKADDQSHSMAQEALHSNDTGTKSGLFNLADYNALGVDDINKMTTSSSSLWPQVSSKLQGYGLSLTEDKQYMKSPFGTFPTDASPEQMAAAIKQIAQKFGVSSAEVDKGIAQAQATAEALSQKALAEVQQLANQKTAAAKGGKGDNGASDKDKNGDDLKKGDDSADGKDRKLANEKSNADGSDKNSIDWDQRAREVNAYRDRLQEQLGVEPIWNKEDDLFKKIHEHYVMLDKQNIFVPASVTKQIASTHPQ